ncbi:DUF2691 family protein [Peribacillus butanolivorans]|uniref:DUF2691 family protein n=1 Tax=Peribacillus butanolivorans TaxID=421767 RepID=UPI0037C5F104
MNRIRDITFEIPNTVGKYLFDILSDINLKGLAWRIGGGESYIIENNTLGKPLFPSTGLLNGDTLYKNIFKDNYYLIGFSYQTLTGLIYI